jgi:hypothetical protein
MFDFKNTESVVVGFPTKLYWSVAGTLTVLLLIGQLFLTFPEWTTNTIDFMGWNRLKNTRLYTEAMKREGEKQKSIMEKNSVVRRGTGKSGLSGKTQNSEQRPSKQPANGMNGPRIENGVQQKGQRQNVSSLFGRRSQLTHQVEKVDDVV